MGTQSEAVLEDNLIAQLGGLGYKRVTIKDEESLVNNLRKKLEEHNKLTLTDQDFKFVLNNLGKGTIFEKASTLRGKLAIPQDDGVPKYIEFLDTEHWCQNIFQVTNQVTVRGKYENRYDVTLLVNGLPLVQIELKKRGLEMKEAFNQIQRYQKHSYGHNYGLFNYVQIFVISNGVNTKYYTNNREQTFKQTFYWTDSENKKIRTLEAFASVFLEPCHLSKMICKYIVLHNTDKKLMILRPYQYYATEGIIDRIENTDKNGYIWHTTGSGKTLTAFKAAQILTVLPKVHKVIFVVDRKDLDYQTTREFNNFSEGSIDGTDSTKTLVKQFADNTKLIVTTIQKLNTAISKQRYAHIMNELAHEKIVFIFDECHRSQFGETHKRINQFFPNNQLIGFTGTPIFLKNASSNKGTKRTTASLFDKRLHKYLITHAIKDENVLKFSIEYVGKYTKKDSATAIDIEVEDIDTKELLESDERLEKIVDYILLNHNKKTYRGDFNSIMAVSNIQTLIKYYELFRRKEHKLKIATIFSYSANEEDMSIDGLDESDGSFVDQGNINVHSRDKLEEFMGDYNNMFGTNFSTKSSKDYYNYYNDISRRTKAKEIDILLVVNMFLTGFDAKRLNTAYIDKSLINHGLIQAFSRTNRILNERKTQGNIVCFRNLKKDTDDAIALFSDEDAKEIVLVLPYEDYVKKANKAIGDLFTVAPTLESVDDFETEEDILKFVQAFRSVMRIKNTLETFVDFTFNDLSMSEQDFEDYKSMYLDIYDQVKSEKDKTSILDDVDFELILVQRDQINLLYIVRLLAEYKETSKKNKKKHIDNILSIIDGNANLRSKRELIEAFIDKNLEGISGVEDVEEAFEDYWEFEKKSAFKKLCNEEDIDQEKMQTVIDDYLYSGKIPLADDIYKTLKVKLKLKERKERVPKILDKILNHIEKFSDF